MANTRKHCQGNVHIHEVKLPFEEWLAGLIEHTENNGWRECSKCGEDCECVGIDRSYTGIQLKWRCERSHAFEQDVSYSQLQQMYEKTNPIKFVHETIYPGKLRKSDMPKKWRHVV